MEARRVVNAKPPNLTANAMEPRSRAVATFIVSKGLNNLMDVGLRFAVCDYPEEMAHQSTVFSDTCRRDGMAPSVIPSFNIMSAMPQGGPLPGL